MEGSWKRKDHSVLVNFLLTCTVLPPIAAAYLMSATSSSPQIIFVRHGRVVVHKEESVNHPGSGSVFLICTLLPQVPLADINMIIIIFVIISIILELNVAVQFVFQSYA